MNKNISLNGMKVVCLCCLEVTREFPPTGNKVTVDVTHTICESCRPEMFDDTLPGTDERKVDEKVASAGEDANMLAEMVEQIRNA
jgi:hypothetical protein